MFSLISLIVLVCALIPSHEAHIIRGNATDLQALISFKAAISDDQLGALSSWNETNTTLHFCNWFGVTCGAPRHPDRVTNLSLVSFNLTGTLSPYLANLTFLRLLNLSNNNFHGQIPSEFGRLSRLQHLDLSYNFLEGEIPHSLTHCSKLRFISLWSNNLAGQIPANFSHCLNLESIIFHINQLSGTIPASLSALPKLHKLGLHQNQLTGGIPPSLGNATSLVRIELGANSLEGHIPYDLGRLTSLKYIGLALNKLSGKIPASLFNISSINVFNVGGNNLSGVLPRDVGSTLPALQVFDVYENQLGGPIPVSLSNASGLQELNIQQNMFIGLIPKSLGSLPYLTTLNLAINQLEAKEAQDWGFLTSLSNCTYLNGLEISENNLQGLLPSSVANLSTQLTWLGMADNQISGIIPPGIGRYNKLTAFGMTNNLLTGTIPSTIGMLQNLNVLSLYGNQLHGKIPTSIGNLTKMDKLDLGENKLHGSIPSSIRKLLQLNLLVLRNNKLSGNLPGQALSQLSSLSRFLDLSYNSFTGPLPSQISSLINLNALDVSNNRLSGEIPGSLGGCQTLEQLHMQGNLFQGSIPSGLSGLKGIQELDVSRNNLSGPIPRFLETFHFLYYLNLSFNDLDGRVPKGGVFGNASAISVIGNSKLCGGIQEMNLRPCDSIDGMSSRRISSLQLKVIIPLIVASVLVIFFSAAYCIRKRKSTTNPHTQSPNEPFVQVSYAEIQKATDGFSSSNLIGVGSFGSVYKGIIDSNPNKVVAIKVLNLDQRGAEKSFIAECDSLKVIRHRNLVSIITVCSSIDRNGDDFKALIFEYMPNGSLDEWLHPRVDENTNLKSFSLVQRLNIVLDVALALDYLHHQCETPMVHCDLKPSNVLLDNDMVAHVGDFGLARFLCRTVGSSQGPYSSIGVKGSIGYIAPEYGMGGPVTTQGDVYGYGVLLLETFTGKRPTDGMFHGDLNLHKYVEMVYPYRVLDVIDPSIVLNEEETNDLREWMHESMILVFKVGLSCSQESATERMVMGDVIKELHQVKKILDRGRLAGQTQSNSN